MGPLAESSDVNRVGPPASLSSMDASALVVLHSICIARECESSTGRRQALLLLSASFSLHARYLIANGSDDESFVPARPAGPPCQAKATDPKCGDWGPCVLNVSQAFFTACRLQRFMMPSAAAHTGSRQR